MPLNNGAINEILPFGHGAGANVMAQGEYVADMARTAGNQSGLARSKFVNKIWRQSAHLVAGVGQWIANRYAPGVRDNGDLDAIEAGMTAAVQACAAQSWPLMAVEWSASETYSRRTIVIGGNGKLYVWLKVSGPGAGGVGAKDPTVAGNAAWWLDYAASIAPAVPKGLVAPFYRVVFGGSDGRRPIFWGNTTPDEGWVLCDGGSDGAGGNVPNLKDRMLIGAGGSYASGSTGGSSTHSHSLSGAVGYATLSVAQLASHLHTFGSRDAPAPAGGGLGVVTTGNNGGNSTNSTGSSQSHTHSMSGSVNSANNLPPYYALAYIMKL